MVKNEQNQFQFDLKNNQLFKRNEQNFINEVSHEQMNSLRHTSILEIHLSNGHIVEPHYHQDSDELIYCISGAVTISMIDPKTKKLHSYHANASEVINIPQGWWHYIVAEKDHTKILGIFNQATPQVVLASDVLSGTPATIMARTYCLDERKWQDLVKKIPPSVFIGPPEPCPPKNKYESNKKEHLASQYEDWNPYSYRRA